MPASLPPPPSHIHLVGIGGTGLSAIARVLLQKGYRVSGSDRALNALAEALARDGATIYAGHDAANLFLVPLDGGDGWHRHDRNAPESFEPFHR